MQLFVKAMDPEPFPSRFPLFALAAALGISAVLLVAAAFSGQDGLIATAALVFLASVTACVVLVARSLAEARASRKAMDIDGALLKVGRPSRETRPPCVETKHEPSEEEALRRMQKAEAIERLRDGIVHDLNNRLMVISANIDAVARQMKDQPLLQRKLLSALVASDQAALLLARSTAFSRQQSPRIRNVELKDRIESITALMGRSLLRDTVELRVSVADDLWPVAVDPSDFDTAIVTLSAHVRDALAQGGAIRIEASNEHVARGALSDPQAEGDFVRVVIDSTEAGEATQSFGDSAADALSLEGIDVASWQTLNRGLYFLRALGGVTEVTRKGGGLNIALYLRRSTLPAQLRAADGGDQLSGSGTIRSAIEILVVDDEVEVALAVQTMLDEFGYVTHLATDAGLAMRSLQSRMPELVLMDVSMPGTMNGVVLAREVRQLFPRVPIVLFTGNPVVDEDQSEFPLLHKPVVSRDLHAAIQRELRYAGETKVVPLFPHQARGAS